MEQVENYATHKGRSLYSIAYNIKNWLLMHVKLAVCSQFLSSESLQFNCFYEVTIGLTSVGNHEQTTELINA
jgi:hypothetical protein